MKVALCFWGIARSTDFTIESIEKNIWEPLKNANIEYTTFLHTFLLKTPYTNPRALEWNITLKNDIWKMLLPDHYCIEDQCDIDSSLNLKKYRTHGDPWIKEKTSIYIEYSTLDNHIRALHSLSKVTSLWESASDASDAFTAFTAFDAIIYLRPDVRFITPLKIEWITQCKKGKVYIPNFHLIDGWNDRFAIGKPADMRLYGHRFKDAYEYSLKKPLYSERFLAEYMVKHRIYPSPVQFFFRRIRANNMVFPSDQTIENTSDHHNQTLQQKNSEFRRK